MKILGISAFYHDSAATIIENGEIIAAAQEERFTRIKHDSGFPLHAIQFCLHQASSSIDEIDAVAFYDKPLLKFERLLETYYAFAPRGISSFLMAIPVWLREKMFLKKIIIDGLASIESFDRRRLKLLFPEHHLSHAASAFYPSTFEESAVLTIDGVGEWATASICHGIGNRITILRELRFPHSLGLLYSSFTYYLGFKVNSGEYKLMGLAPYGDPSSNVIDRYVEIIKTHLIKIFDGGSIWLNQGYFQYATGLRMIRESQWQKLFGFPVRKPEEELEQHHCNLGMAIQRVTEEVVLKMAKEAKRLTGSRNLCMAGGVALNCVANGKLLNEKIFEEIFIQPAAGDAGGSLGAALAVYHVYHGMKRIKPDSRDGMKGSYLGPEFSDWEINEVLKSFKAKSEYYEDFSSLCVVVARLIAEGNVIGWVQGRMEFGPRALGSRSILGDPRNEEMQKKLNLKIKYRESFRPFAPSVLAEKCSDYFEYDGDSPYMLLVQQVKKGRQIPVPSDYGKFSIRRKLYYRRSDLPSITHIDYSARKQTVHRETNPRYYELISEFLKLTGCGVIMNTSFNVRGEPIVCTPDDAYRCFMRTEMDYLVIGNYLCRKEDQPSWVEKPEWRQEMQLD